MNFNELNIKKEVLEAISKKGFESMTDIQAKAIPFALEGRDVLGQAQTGTGKTAAFAIPIVNRVELENKNVQALILVPTRELALQVSKEINSLGNGLGVKSVCIFGGESMEKQLRELKEKPQVVVATPGRCIDLINRNKLKIKNIKFFALDEFDEMLNMGFVEDVNMIEEMTPDNKQTLLFSATIPPKIKTLANNYLTNPEIIKVKSKSIVADKVDQYYIKSKAKQKNLILKNLIDLNNQEKIIIFTQTKRSADEVSDFLLGYGLMIGKIHGDLPQKTRTLTIEKFRNNQLNYLVATDVVARGIDIDNVGIVINYELPQDIEYYIHRIGRTARGVGNKGRSITLVTPNAYDKEFRHYSKKLSVDIKEMEKPKLDDIINILKEKYIKQIVSKKDVTDELFFTMAHELLEEKEIYQLLANLLFDKYPQLSKEENLKLLDKMEETTNRGDNGRSNGNRGNGNKGGGNRGNRSSRNKGSNDRNRSGKGSYKRQDNSKGKKRKPKNNKF